MGNLNVSASFSFAFSFRRYVEFRIGGSSTTLGNARSIYISDFEEICSMKT